MRIPTTEVPMRTVDKNHDLTFHTSKKDIQLKGVEGYGEKWGSFMKFCGIAVKVNIADKTCYVNKADLYKKILDTIKAPSTKDTSNQKYVDKEIKKDVMHV